MHREVRLTWFSSQLLQSLQCSQWRLSVSYVAQYNVHKGASLSCWNWKVCIYKKYYLSLNYIILVYLTGKEYCKIRNKFILNVSSHNGRHGIYIITHHVCARGSWAAFPHFSIVNNCGPLLPYNSAKPFIGTRDVPVTNCSKRDRVSLLKEYTACNRENMWIK